MNINLGKKQKKIFQIIILLIGLFIIEVCFELQNHGGILNNITDILAATLGAMSYSS